MKNKVTQIVILSLGIGLWSTLSAQTVDDAIRYSLQFNTGTARSAGVSGALGALGADLSVANINPAGTAEFRKSEYTISLGIPTSSVMSRFAGTVNDEPSVNNTTLDNIAVLFFYDPENFDIKSFNFSLGMNKVADFDEEFYYSGNSDGTIVQRFLERAEGLFPDELDPFEAGPAFDAGAIFNFDNGTSYESDFTTLRETIFREQFVDRSGSIREIFLNFATNVKNKFSLGFTMGVPIVDFDEIRRYTERDDLSTAGFFDELFFDENLSTSGVGINVKVGAIYKITQRLRLGAAFHSPTWYFLQDNYDTYVNYAFTSLEGSERFEASSPFSEFDYRLQSPWRAMVGIAHIYDLGDVKGFVNIDAEYVDYGSNKFNLTANSTDPLDQFAEDDLNDEISASLASGFNFRAGTEVAYKKFRGRIGGAFNSSVYDADGAFDVNPQISFGLGFRGNRMYVDASYVIQSYDYTFSPYRLLNADAGQLINNEVSRNRITITFGSKFGN
jgi:long-subunit fatty acid transport protein